MTKTHDAPTATTGDLLHTTAKVLANFIPVLGAPAAELFNTLIVPPLEKRRVVWMNDVAEHLRALEEHGNLKIEDLQDNEIFITTMMQASQAAVRNHQCEKLTALRNTVLNAALPHAPEDSLQQHFINQVDTFTVWHIRLLDLFKDPPAWFERNGVTRPKFALSSDLERLLIAAWPELKNQYDFLNVIFEELEAKGLHSGGGLRTMMSEQGAYDKRTTEMGDSFLDFITTP